MVSDSVGGVWTYSLELIAGLVARDCNVTLATMGPRPSPDQRAELSRLSDVRLIEGSFALEWERPPHDEARRAGEWLLELGGDVTPDVVHLNSFVHGALPWRAPVVVVAHSCVLSWHQAVRNTPAPQEWDAYARDVRAGLRAADAVVAPTIAMLRSLELLYGLSRPGYVIPNGRAAHCVPSAPKEPMVLAVGRLWDEAKNLAALDAVAPRLGHRVVVAGRAAHPAGSTSFVSDRVEILGELSFHDLRGWLARAAVFALPARYEPFGLAGLEAGLAGCALVLGDIPSLREVWHDAAVYVDPNDQESLLRTLKLLLEDSGLRIEMAHRARARALRFSSERMAESYLQIYKALHGVMAVASSNGGRT
jgi:glycogen synthase